MSSRNPRPKAVSTIVAQYLGLSIMFHAWDNFQGAHGWQAAAWVVFILAVWLTVRGLVIKEATASAEADTP